MHSNGLRLYATAMTVTTAVLLLISAYSFATGGTASFEEIDVERINVVEPDGTVKLVISNRARQAEATIGGEELPIDRTRPPGMIFFNDAGDEVGGLIFEGNRMQGGAGLMFDQTGQDQVIRLGNLDWMDEAGERRRESGLELWDRPTDVTILECITMQQEAETIEDEDERARTLADVEQRCSGVTRGSIGRSADGQVGIELRDGNGDVRLRLGVEDDGRTAIEFLDAEGEVVKTIDVESS